MRFLLQAGRLVAIPPRLSQDMHEDGRDGFHPIGTLKWCLAPLLPDAKSKFLLDKQSSFEVRCLFSGFVDLATQRVELWPR